MPSLQRLSSSYLVRTEQLNVLVDVGPSVVRRLLEYGYTTRDIDIIVLTHFHVDHSADLSTFLFASNYDVVPRTKELAIIGGEGFQDFYRGLLTIYPWLLPKSYELFSSGVTRRSTEKSGIVITILIWSTARRVSV